MIVESLFRYQPKFWELYMTDALREITLYQPLHVTDAVQA
jgi:hypothetical protein